MRATRFLPLPPALLRGLCRGGVSNRTFASYRCGPTLAEASEGEEVDGGRQEREAGKVRELACEIAAGLASDKLPCFEISPLAVTTLHSPSQLLSQLLSSCSNARRRVHLASLYVGTGPISSQLLHTLATSEGAPIQTDSITGENSPPPAAGSLNTPPMERELPPREIHLLTDYQRAHRRGADGLAPIDRLTWLKSRLPSSRISLFRHPSAPPFWLERFLPRELFELCGVQHAKVPPLFDPAARMHCGEPFACTGRCGPTQVCVFDDDVLLTGANLSDDYFSSRQDRALLIREAPHLADFYCKLPAETETTSPLSLTAAPPIVQVRFLMHLQIEATASTAMGVCTHQVRAEQP